LDEPTAFAPKKKRRAKRGVEISPEIQRNAQRLSSVLNWNG
jgi:hypothetical protein